jgi:folate-binding protein YgfZ
MLAPDQLAQYQALRTSAAYAPLARTQISLTGGDRATLLHKFCTQDVLSLRPCQGSEAFICNVQGKIVGHVYFFVGEDTLVLDSAAGQGDALVGHLDRYVIREDVQFADESAQRGDILVAGPEAGRKLRELTGAEVPTEMFAHRAAKLGGADIWLRRTPYVAPESYFVSYEVAQEPAILAALDDAAILRCAPEVMEIARIESGTPLYGVDITVENLPQEVARDATAIHFRKGCYLGQETVARIDALGHVNKLLVQLKFPPEATVAPGEELLHGAKKVGRVTSVCISPAANAHLALAYLRREHTTPGTQIGAAEVCALRAHVASE